MKQCPTCGSSVTDNSDICSDCGMELQGASVPAPPPLPNFPPGAIVPAADAPQISPDSFSTQFDYLPVAGSSSGEATVVLDDSDVSSGVFTPDVSGVPISTSSVAASLTLMRGGVETTERFALGKRSVVGRFDPDSGPVDVDMGPLPEASYVSRHHAEIICKDDGQWLVKDLGSRNGTFVRSDSDSQFQRVAGEQEVTSGCEVSLGNARFKFQIGS